MKKAKKTRVIPGYHLTIGIVITLLSLIVLIPLASVLVYALKLSPGEWFRLIMKENVRNAFLTSIGCSFLAAVINTVFGLILAWTLVKYEFPGKKLLDGFIELPFALPTAVAGITLSKLFSDYIKAEPADVIISDGDEIKFGNISMKVITTPGHTKGGVCYLAENDLFSGDTLFLRSVGRCDFPGGDKKELERSIREKIYTLDDDIIVHPGHGNDTKIYYEKRYNMYVSG